MLSNMLWFICFLISSFIFNAHSYNNKCLRHQETLLLQLRDELIFDPSLSTKLGRWNKSAECCLWHGVECDASGHVVSLQLDGEAISGGIGDSSSLFRFKYLQKLNLAFNDIYHTRPAIPKGIGSLTCLTHLNLSRAGFVGQVPSEILTLTRLASLHISSNLTLSLELPNLEMLLQNLTELRELNLDGVNITSSHEKRKWSHIESSHLSNLTSLSMAGYFLHSPFPKSFWQLHSLSILRLDGNNLSAVALDDLFTNFPSLTTLTLSECSLKGSIPSTFAKLTKLIHVDLSYNSLTGSLPSTLFANLTELIHVDLSHNSLTGSLPSTLFANLTKLIHVDLSSNHLTGSLCFTFFEGLSNLAYLDLSENSFSGNIPHSLYALPSLLELFLHSNQFNGTFQPLGKCSSKGSIPSTFANLTKLVHVDLSHNFLTGSLPSTLFEGLSNLVHLNLWGNSFYGNIPQSLFALPSLLELDVSDNQFNGTFQLDTLLSLTNLTELGLSGNSLSVDVGNVNSSSYGGLQLKVLHLGSCNLSRFPDFIKDLDLHELDLSANSIEGEIPSWIWGTHLWYLDLSFNLLIDFQKPYHIPASLEFLLLGTNQFRGELQLPIALESKLQFLTFSNNSLSGSIPTFLCNATHLDSLDLSGNKLSGSIPPCLLQNIIGLDLNQNNINGNIRDHFPSDCRLEYLYLNNNSIQGKIPKSLENCGLLLSMDIGNNNISGNISDIFPMDCNLRYLVLNNNNLEGKIPKSLKSCMSLVFMDVGNNNINDTFPCMLSSSFSVLVLHSNRFHGEVTCNMTWSALRILDISSNHFSGHLESINFSSWLGMMHWSDAQSYDFGVTLIMKGIELKLKTIWPKFGSIDFSCNNFIGEIPNAIGDLTSLHLLNLSHNALNASIPESFGQLSNLESLDLSVNQLTGPIPEKLGELTFLAVLNLSYNKLVGMIPKGRQIQTFSAESFEGNPGLCGFPLNTNCSHTDELSPREHEDVEEKREIEWEYVSAALGYVVGFGSIIWLLMFCRSFRHKYFGKIDEIIEEVFDGRNRRRRRARMAATARNRVRRQ